jgi:hypothetical protein
VITGAAFVQAYVASAFRALATGGA